MNTNVIALSHQIPIQSSGTLSIIGQAYGKVVFMATGLSVIGWLDCSSFSSNCIETSSLLGHEGVVIFEYKMNGHLRNPRKLLKSVRNKLMRAINAAQDQFEVEMNELDWQVSMATHHPNRFPGWHQS